MLRIRSERSLKEADRLLDALVQSGVLERDARGRYMYGKKGRAPRTRRIIGTLRVTNRGNGVVVVGDSEEINISARYMHTALHGDTVAVVPFARKAARGARRAEEAPQGEIVEIISRANPSLVGRIERSGHFFIVVPDNRKIRRDIYVPAVEARKANVGDKVVVSLQPWTDPLQNPEGTVVEVLGPSGDPHAEVLSVARSFGLPLGFPDAVEKETAKMPTSIQGSALKGRLDLRGSVCFTIDPVDAKDFDDALSIEKLDGGSVRIGVHIADVSHYVREGSALDVEARKRGTSVYLVNEVIPMLPEALSNELCSLKPDVDRLTYSVMMDVNTHGTVARYEIRKSVIRSVRRFTYEEAQQTLESGKGELRAELELLNGTAKLLYRKRRKRGSLDFDSQEVKFEFDSAGLPSRIIRKERLDAHRLVEECMLLANQTVARHIGGRKSETEIRPFIYRVHDLPDPSRLRDLANFVKQFGYSLDARNGVTSRSLQKLIDQVRGSEVEFLINEVALRSMAKAVYSERNIGHYGLAFTHYSHFTSPIRRYPDLIVHRLLAEYEHGVKGARVRGLAESVAAISRSSSERERVAVQAERESVKVMQVEYMRRHVGDVLDGVIGGVTEFGLFVEINDLLIEGLVRVRDLADDYYLFDEKRYALRGRSTGKEFRLGDRVRVQVISVDPREGEIDMVVV